MQTGETEAYRYFLSPTFSTYDLTNDGAWCCARPSGTEPKVKFYMGVKGTSFDDAQTKLAALSDAVMKVVTGE